jgi:predicted DNA-binding protein
MGMDKQKVVPYSTRLYPGQIQKIKRLAKKSKKTDAQFIRDLIKAL